MSTPQQPDPDAKDWTWVLDRPCPDCGFDTSSVGASEVAGQLRTASTALGEAVVAPGSDIRPQPAVWSALEYGCHVRDAFIVYGTRFASMLQTDDPLFPDWNQDDTALAERYWEQDPGKVAAELAVETELITNLLDSVGSDDWQRPGRRSNGSAFTVDTLAHYLLHDVVHHVHDVAAA